ncbi:MAG: hypothetical protein H0W53_09405 [Acidobacteria bacterium]|nr:hypothetical protein [Acidobacteriota bacterium]
MRLLGQMALVALVIGTSVAAASTERVTASLVLTSAIAWAFVPLIQLGTGLWLIRGAATGRRTHALEAYFDTHRPWSLFILAFHAAILVWPSSRGFALMFVPAAVVPIALTALALTRLCREVLGASAGAARRMVVMHQLMTCAVAGAYAAWASAYLPRLVGLVR